MASVNKIIIVGNLGRGWLGRTRPSERYATEVKALLHEIQQVIDLEDLDLARYKITRELRPFLETLDRWYSESPFAFFDGFDLSDRQRLLSQLSYYLFNQPLDLTLRASRIRKRFGSVHPLPLPDGRRPHGRNQYRASHARYALFRHRHFLPASAALINLR